jgi:3-phenylpropionate/cinnamic acid dioxygenase small subunit
MRCGPEFFRSFSLIVKEPVLKKYTQHRSCILCSLVLLVSFFVCACSPSRNADVENRLKQLEDREEIRQLLVDYGRFLDQRDFESFSELFAEKDGEWVGGMGSARGRRGILKLMEEKIGRNAGEPNTSNFHLFTNQSIQLKGERAEAKTKWVFVIKNESNQPQPFYLGHYEDQLIRENGHWKFLKRAAYTDIPQDNPKP